MANNKSSRKRIKINKRNRLENKFYKTSVKTLTKVLLKKTIFPNIPQNLIGKEELQNLLNSSYSLIDKGTKKKVFHKNRAARKKSQLAKSLKNMISLNN